MTPTRRDVASALLFLAAFEAVVWWPFLIWWLWLSR